nr:hypothetical protein [Tanacetum cinerariifolium]
MENYKNVSQDIRNQLDAKVEAVQIILTRIDNDIYSTVDACPNACEMWKAIGRLKQDESINVQDLETNFYWEFEKFTSQDGKSLELYYSRGKAIVNFPTPTYDQEPAMVVDNDEMSKDKKIDKLMALISLTFNKIYKPTNKNLTSSNTSRANQDNTLRINKGTGYDNQMTVNVAGDRENVEQADWRDDTDDEPKDQELEAHYLYMAHIQEDEDDDLARERDLLASLIEKLKCETDDNKNRNKFLESSNKTLVDKLKGAIEDFKTQNKSLESSNNHLKEANKELSKANQLMFKDLKKFQAKLDRYHDVNYSSKVEIDSAKAK